MALIDEEKLQTAVGNILKLLREQKACCSFVSAQWMSDDNDAPVFVLISENGTVTVKDSPTGDIQDNPALPLKPLVP